MPVILVPVFVLSVFILGAFPQTHGCVVGVVVLVLGWGKGINLPPSLSVADDDDETRAPANTQHSQSPIPIRFSKALYSIFHPHSPRCFPFTFLISAAGITK